ncbi:MAG TPA: translation initiation factor IF-2 subunit beta [Candidatus Acidoferrum sp.]|nr:translation initiation factor IF-2 subunit beta [Candidatus Acidoferrum sp.]
MIYAANAKWTRVFVKDWIPFFVLFLSFEAMREIPYNTFGVVHVNQLGSVEVQLFRTLPTLLLQEFYRSPFLDYLGAFFYSLHFIIPTVFAFVLWRYSPKNYGKYVCALLVCSYSALITALLYPTAPPWYAYPMLPVRARTVLQIPHFTRVLSQVDTEIGVPLYRTIFGFIESNPFAAFPSLHAAYPWLVSLYAIKIKRVKALPVVVLPIGVWFSAVYLGEHYIIDLVGGVAYSTCAFFVAEKLIPRFSLSVTKRWLKGFVSKRGAREIKSLILCCVCFFLENIHMEYDYESLLKRARSAIPDVASKVERLEIPHLTHSVIGMRTVIYNFKEIAGALDRDPQHLMKFLSGEMATAATMQESRAIFQGKFPRDTFERLLQRYMESFVVCPICKRPDTKIVKEKRLSFLVCKACGARSAIKQL